MKFTRSVLGSLALLFTTAQGVDMKGYKPSDAVEAGFKNFIYKFYIYFEEYSSGYDYFTYWHQDGTMDIADTKAKGYVDIMLLTRLLVPETRKQNLWNTVSEVTVTGETETNKTYTANLVVKKSDVEGNCFLTKTKADFTVLKDEAGNPILRPSSRSISLYHMHESEPRFTNMPCPLTLSRRKARRGGNRLA
ncbi:hypothetical protein PZA11_003727 [Diplocarpon coronariae]|nr:hypothetical protein JHW43_008155 [Diplocarpon mali]